MSGETAGTSPSFLRLLSQATSRLRPRLLPLILLCAPFAVLDAASDLIPDDLNIYLRVAVALGLVLVSLVTTGALTFAADAGLGDRPATEQGIPAAFARFFRRSFDFALVQLQYGIGCFWRGIPAWAALAFAGISLFPWVSSGGVKPLPAPVWMIATAVTLGLVFLIPVLRYASLYFLAPIHVILAPFTDGHDSFAASARLTPGVRTKLLAAGLLIYVPSLILFFRKSVIEQNLPNGAYLVLDAVVTLILTLLWQILQVSVYRQQAASFLIANEPGSR